MTPASILIDTGLGDEVAALLDRTMAAVRETGRSGSVVLKVSVKCDKESGKTVARGRVHATWPDGDDSSRTKKTPAQTVAVLSSDHPGQQRIDE